MFAVRPFYLNSSGYVNYGERIRADDGVIRDSENSMIIYPNFIDQRFLVELPIASSIESTMEWCDRVARKHHWVDDYASMVPTNTNVIDSSGFIWKTVDGLKNEIRIIPNNTEPYSLESYSTLPSGFYNQYREIVKFMGDNTGYYWPTSGFCWPQMTSNAVWLDMESVQKSPKLHSSHYHQYIYRGSRTAPTFEGGVYSKRIYVLEDGASSGLNEGWVLPESSYRNQLDTQLSLWNSLGYNVGAGTLNDNHLFLNSLFLAFLANGQPDGDDIDTYSETFVPPEFTPLFFPPAGASGCPPQLISDGIYSSKIAGFTEIKGGARAQQANYGLVSYSGEIYNYAEVNIPYPRYYSSRYLALFENTFSAYYFHVGASGTNKKLGHMLGFFQSNLNVIASSVWPGKPASASGLIFTDMIYSILLGSSYGTPYSGFFPPGRTKSEFYVTDEWTGNFRIGVGFINGYVSSTDYNTINKTADKIRNGDYYTLADLSYGYPTIQPSGWQFISPEIINEPWSSTCSTNFINTDIITNLWSSGNDTLFLAIFHYPFEGSGLDNSSYYMNPPDLYSSGYTLPATYPAIAGPSMTDAIVKKRKGAIISCNPRPYYPPSSFRTGLGDWIHNTEWW